jgi:hypothetical protein
MTIVEAYGLGFLTPFMLALVTYIIRNIDKNPEAW